MNRYLTRQELALLAGFFGMLALGALTESCKDQWFPPNSTAVVSSNYSVEANR